MQDGTEEGAIRAALQARLANYQLPRRFTFHAELPRDDSGKLLKRRLRDPYWEGIGRAI